MTFDEGRGPRDSSSVKIFYAVEYFLTLFLLKYISRSVESRRKQRDKDLFLIKKNAEFRNFKFNNLRDYLR